MSSRSATPFDNDDEDVESIGTASDGEDDIVISDFRDDETGPDQDDDDDDDEEEDDDDPDYDPADDKVRVLNVPDKLVGKNSYEWSGTKSRRQRIAKRNILIHLPGNKSSAKNIVDRLAVWELFFTKVVIDAIVRYTNEKIREEKEKSRKEGRKDTTYKNELTSLELRALIGLYYIAGATKQNSVDSREMFDTKYGLPFFRATMTENRFVYLTSMLRFDNKVERQKKQKTDRMAAIRELFDHIVNISKNSYVPSDTVTIDEQLLRFHGRCGFRMYLPNKPDRSGIKIVMMCDARTSYMINAEVYTGKDTTATAASTVPLAERYLLTLSGPIHQLRRTVVCDNWFTSIPAAEKLIEKGVTLVGTLRKNKREIPPLFLQTKNRDLNSSMFAFRNEMTLLSWCPPKKKKKIVILLSTTHDLPDKDRDVRLPEIVEFYNQTKGGVDVFDRLCKNFSTSRKTRRWTLAVFFGLLNIVGINSFILWRNNIDSDTTQSHCPQAELSSKQKRSRKEYLKSLGYSLIEPFLRQRLAESSRGVQTSLRNLMRLVLGEQEEETAPCAPLTSAQAGRCSFCQRAGRQDRKSRTRCTQCCKFICAEHQYKKIICPTCCNQ